MIPEHLAVHLKPLIPIPTGQAPVLPPQRDIDAVLFDVYGTLFISGSGDISLAKSAIQTDDALAELLVKHAIGTPPDILQTQFLAAIEVSHAESRKKGIEYPEVQIDMIWQKVAGFKDLEAARAFAIEYEALVNPVAPMPHIAALLAACRKRGLVMGIISNAQFYTPLLFDWFLDHSLQALGFSEELLIYSWQHEIAKPSEKLYRLARERLHNQDIAPDRTLYIGNDMLNDILPAGSTGFKTALFAGDKRSLRLRREDPRCAGLKPDLVVTDLLQIVEWLGL